MSLCNIIFHEKLERTSGLGIIICLICTNLSGNKRQNVIFCPLFLLLPFKAAKWSRKLCRFFLSCSLSINLNIGKVFSLHPAVSFSALLLSVAHTIRDESGFAENNYRSESERLREWAGVRPRPFFS